MPFAGADKRRFRLHTYGIAVVMQSHEVISLDEEALYNGASSFYKTVYEEELNAE